MPTVNIYLATTNTARQTELENRCLPQLPHSEQQRYKTLHPKRQVEWLCARGLLHTALQTHYNLGNGLRHVQRHEKGGLHFPDRNMSLSISHSGNTVAVALIDQRAALGLDLETIRTRKLTGHADKVFSPIEIAWLETQPPEQRLAVFYRLWTSKEACIKACRQSVWQDMSSLSFGFQQGCVITSPNPVYHGDWQLAWGAPLADTQMAVALNTNKINQLQLFFCNDNISELHLTPHHLTTARFSCIPPA